MQENLLAVVRDPLKNEDGASRTGFCRIDRKTVQIVPAAQLIPIWSPHRGSFMLGSNFGARAWERYCRQSVHRFKMGLRQSQRSSGQAERAQAARADRDLRASSPGAAALKGETQG